MSNKKSIDLNADLGEGYPFDNELFPLISSANIACGGHAGDEKSIRDSLRQCLLYDVAAGPHPSYPDKENFGRKTLTQNKLDLQQSIRSQMDLFCELAQKEKITPHHVKLHGALYNDCFDNEQLIAAVLEIIGEYGIPFVYGPAQSTFNSIAYSNGFQIVDEVFADRAYLPSAKLASRSVPGSVLKNTEQVAGQLNSILLKHEVRSIDGSMIPLQADTICLHGDNEHAINFAKTIRGLLQEWKFTVSAPGGLPKNECNEK